MIAAVTTTPTNLQTLLDTPTTKSSLLTIQNLGSQALLINDVSLAQFAILQLENVSLKNIVLATASSTTTAGVIL